MADILKPETADQLLAAVQWAVSEQQPLEVVGQGSKRALGRPTQTAATLDLSALSGIESYEPAELYLTAKAGTPMADVQAALAAANQYLAFEPPDLGPLLGMPGDGGSIGGAVATNLAGPRRIKEGAARDHVLGFHAVSGRGEIFKSGGTVVKNVTGFDLSKLMAGSFGTLGVMSDVTLKTVPAPEKVRTVLVFGLADADAMRLMSQALGSPHDVSAAAHLPAAIAALSGVARVADAGQAVTAIRVEGPAPSVAHRTSELLKELSPYGASDELHTSNAKAFWREVGNVAYYVGREDLPIVWRISVPPASGADVAAAIIADLGGEVFYDWGGGLIWLATTVAGDGDAATIRAHIIEVGGHATLIRAPADVRATTDVFQPLSGGEAMVSAQIKAGFDPDGILNPARMYQQR